jgi:hypothetical protein
MNLDRAPPAVLAKLLTMDEQAGQVTEQAARTEARITSLRAKLQGDGFSKELEQQLRKLLDAQAALRWRADRQQSMLSACKGWLDGLPAGAVLEPVEVKADGDLEEVRSRLKAAQDELAALRAVPMASADIEERVKAYVREMARPTISGIGDGERLKVTWPGAGWDSSGPREHRADILPMMALLHGDPMVAALMAEITRMANDPMPPAARKRRISELEAEIDALQRQELALSGQPAADAPPPVLLGVRVAARGERAT